MAGAGEAWVLLPSFVMRSTSFALAPLFFTAMALVACAEPLEGTPVAADNLCTEIVRLVCDADRSCFPETSRSDCVEVQEEQCALSVQPLLDDPRLEYDAARGGAFLHRLAERGAACFAEPPDYDQFLTMFEGTGHLGADCTPARLDARALRVSALSCVGESACRIHLRADGSPEGVCEARRDEACSHPLDCGAGQFCSLPATWQAGVWGECRPLRADGWACQTDLECASRHCGETCGAVPLLEQPLAVDYPTFVLADEPVSYVRFAEVSGRLADVSGHSAAIRVHGMPGHAAEGISERDEGGSLELSEGAYVVLPLELQDAETWALEVWFRRGEVELSQPLLEFLDGESVGTHIWNHDRGDKLYANVLEAEPVEGGPAHTIMSAEGVVQVDTWHHAVLSFDGEVARLYLDGVRVGATTMQGGPAVAGDLHIGHRVARGESPERFFVGRLDEIAIYDHALLAPSVLAHHEVGARGERVNGFPLFRWLAQ